MSHHTLPAPAIQKWEKRWTSFWKLRRVPFLHQTLQGFICIETTNMTRLKEKEKPNFSLRFCENAAQPGRHLMLLNLSLLMCLGEGQGLISRLTPWGSFKGSNSSEKARGWGHCPKAAGWQNIKPPKNLRTFLSPTQIYCKEIWENVTLMKIQGDTESIKLKHQLTA